MFLIGLCTELNESITTFHSIKFPFLNNEITLGHFSMTATRTGLWFLIDLIGFPKIEIAFRTSSFVMTKMVMHTC